MKWACMFGSASCTRASDSSACDIGILPSTLSSVQAASFIKPCLHRSWPATPASHINNGSKQEHVSDSYLAKTRSQGTPAKLCGKEPDALNDPENARNSESRNYFSI